MMVAKQSWKCAVCYGLLLLIVNQADRVLGQEDEEQEVQVDLKTKMKFEQTINKKFQHNRIWKDMDLDLQDLSKDLVSTSTTSTSHLRGLQERYAELSSRPRVGPFQIQLYWTPNACWQGDCSYKEWCMQCEGYHCNVGDKPWVEPCRPGLREQLWYWVPVLEVYDNANANAQKRPSATFGQLQTRSPTGTRLCLERYSEEDYKLQVCAKLEERQWFRGLQDNSAQPFELYPMTTYQSDVEDPACFNMHHHPRQFEECILTTCRAARKYDTNLWILVWNHDSPAQYAWRDWDPREYYRLGAPRTSELCEPQPFTCGMCTGHCHDDNDCAGDLKCFKRGSNNPTQLVPGCYGRGVPLVNYCHAESGN